MPTAPSRRKSQKRGPLPSRGSPQASWLCRLWFTQGPLIPGWPELKLQTGHLAGRDSGTGRARAPTSLEMYSFATSEGKGGGGCSDMQTTGLESNGSPEDDSSLPRSLMTVGAILSALRQPSFAHSLYPLSLRLFPLFIYFSLPKKHAQG